MYFFKEKSGIPETTHAYRCLSAEDVEILLVKYFEEKAPIAVCISTAEISKIEEQIQWYEFKRWQHFAKYIELKSQLESINQRRQAIDDFWESKQQQYISLNRQIFEPGLDRCTKINLLLKCYDRTNLSDHQKKDLTKLELKSALMQHILLMPLPVSEHSAILFVEKIKEVMKVEPYEYSYFPIIFDLFHMAYREEDVALKLLQISKIQENSDTDYFSIIREELRIESDVSTLMNSFDVVGKSSTLTRLVNQHESLFLYALSNNLLSSQEVILRLYKNSTLCKDSVDMLVEYVLNKFDWGLLEDNCCVSSSSHTVLSFLTLLPDCKAVKLLSQVKINSKYDADSYLEKVKQRFEGHPDMIDRIFDVRSKNPDLEDNDKMYHLDNPNIGSAKSY